MKDYDRDAQGGVCKTGLCLALVDPVTRELIDWPTFGPIPPEDICWPEQYQQHYGIHQFDAGPTQDYARPNDEVAA